MSARPRKTAYPYYSTGARKARPEGPGTKRRIEAIPILANGLVSLVAIAVTSLLAFRSGEMSTARARAYELDREAVLSILPVLDQYKSWRNIDWDSLKSITYEGKSNYGYDYTSTGRFASILESYQPEWMGQSLFNEWEDLQRAKTNFRRKTVRARLVSSSSIRKALLEVEKGFDEMFALDVEQGIYGKMADDHWDEVMPKRIERLEVECHQVLASYMH